MKDSHGEPKDHLGALQLGLRDRGPGDALLSSGRSVVVRINDPLPRPDRVIDLSRVAAQAIGLIGVGTGGVRLDVIRVSSSGESPAG